MGHPGKSRPHSGLGAAPLAAAAGRRDPVRFARSAAGARAGRGPTAGRGRDRDHARESGLRPADRQRHGSGDATGRSVPVRAPIAEVTGMARDLAADLAADSATDLEALPVTVSQIEVEAPPPPPPPPPEPWRRRVLRTLLYGSNVDRNTKARARVGLAVVVFAAVFAVIAARLIMFAVAPESHFVRRGAAKDAVATARPDILDRNGLILATDVRTPSLFAEPRRIINIDEPVELLTAVVPDLDATESRDRLSTKRGFAWLKREITPKQRQEIYRLGLPGVGFLAENKRVYPNSAEVSHLIGH